MIEQVLYLDLFFFIDNLYTLEYTTRKYTNERA